MSRLERSYRRLLRLYPRRYRAGREEEMLGVLLDAAPPGRQRASAADAADLALGALGVRGADAGRAARTRPAAAAGGLVLAVGLAVAVLPGAPAPAPRTPEALPSHFAGYSHFTPDVSSSPPGPVVALYGQGRNDEFVDTRQSIAVGASGAYRRTSHDGLDGGLLSPDGTLVASGEAYRDGSDLPVVSVQDLTTGDVVTHPVAGGRFASPAAWAPDGRHLAVSVQQVPMNEYFAPGQTGGVVVLDLDTGVTRPLPAGVPSHPSGTAFAPDGTRLAVQDLSGEVVVVDLATGSARSLGRADHFIGEWSPDGALLATVYPLDWVADAPQCYPFIAVDGGPVPDCVDGGTGFDRSFVGWTGPRSIAVLVGEFGESDPAVLVDVDLATGDETLLTSIPTGGGDHPVTGIQVPQAVLASGAVVEPPAPDRGRWPLALRLATAAGAAALLSAVVAATVRAVDRRAPVVGLRRRQGRRTGPVPE